MIELLVVMIIIAVLAAIAIPMYVGQRNRAKNASAIEGGRTIMLAVLAYTTANKDEEDPWPAIGTVDKDFLVGAEVIAASEWPGDPFAGADADMRPVEGPGDTTPGRYLYREAPNHATTGRHQIVVYRKNADPFVIP